VTWDTAPAPTGPPIASLGQVAAGRWYDVDLSSLVVGEGSFALRVSSTSTNAARYTSREGTASLQPQLVVVTAPTEDASPPSVAIVSPAPGAVVSGIVPVDVEATDDVGVVSVALQAGDATVGIDTDGPYSFTWDTTMLANGPHTLVAVASDAVPRTSTAAVAVDVENVVDDQPPTTPTDLVATAVGPARVELSWTASTDDVGVQRYSIRRDGAEIGTTSETTFADTSAPPGATSTYVVIACDAAGNTSEPSEPAVATTPAGESLTFAAAGDHTMTSAGEASLAALDASDADLYLALGDLDDPPDLTADWCGFYTSRLPGKGASFPFEIVAGSHEEGDTMLDRYTSCMPDRLDAVVEPGSVYGADYYVDYPAGAPLMRIVMIAPNLTVAGQTYSFGTASPHRQWFVDAVRGARAAGIPWVAVGLHHPCLTVGDHKGCDMGLSLWNLMLAEHVDLVLTGHQHLFQRSKQLGLNPSACPKMAINTFNPGCIVDDGADLVYPQGAGTVHVGAGVFGDLEPVVPNDPETGYYAASSGDSTGFVAYTVTADGIDAHFVASTGTFSDAFSIVAGALPSVDMTPPTPPAGLTAALSGPTQVDLSWSASEDPSGTGIDRYEIFRDGIRVGVTTVTSFIDATAIPGARHTYTVSAHDRAGNVSQASAPLIVTLPGPAPVQVFVSSGDATILEGSPDVNRGGQMYLETDRAPVRQFLVRFDVSGIGTSQVISAQLRLFCVDGSDAGGFFYPVSGSWEEGTVTWNTAPPLPASAVASLGPVSSGTWFEADVTSGLTGGGPVAFRVVASTGDGASYSSREAQPEYIPQLVVTLSA
jgi:fibronectin type 3 domain-containing protein